MIHVQNPDLAPSPEHFQTQRTCLFLEVDGTLVDLVPRPSDVLIDYELLVLLSRLQAHLKGAVALISGRPLEELSRMFAPLDFPMAGIHGFERRCSQGHLYRPTISDSRLDAAREQLARLVEEIPQLMVEDKGPALALHFRGAPTASGVAAAVMRSCAHDLGPEFELLQGNCVIEVKPAAQSKATAIEAFMQEAPFVGLTPIYIGDDRTDFDGFGAVRRHGGMDISVGDLVPARWLLRNPAAVRVWLQAFAAQGAQVVR